MGGKIWILWKEPFWFEHVVASSQMMSGWVSLDSKKKICFIRLRKMYSSRKAGAVGIFNVSASGG